jgi:penicillin-binding protein 1A
VDIEDERFYQHDGVDYYGIARAIFIDLTTNDTQGASTITMQLVRQTILQDEASDMTMARKVREAALAQEVERTYSKEQILMIYLNTINFGDGCWGIQSAALHYFSKDAADLTLTEAALLCGIPQSPEYNNPVSYPDNAMRRRNQVLYRMWVNGDISEDEHDAAILSDLGLNVSRRTADGIYVAPYITSYTRHELYQLFRENPDIIYTGGLDVYTSIDLRYQQWAEDVCSYAEWNTLEEGFEASLTCIDPTTGFILCMRGGRDYYQDQFNTGWQMRRQAGSTFKTFALVTALEKGYSPATIVSTASPFTLGDWKVENYGWNNIGDVSLAEATWYSSNCAYARIIRTLGPQPVAEMAHRMGITSDLVAVPSLVLGTSGVCTMEMASAFGTLANNGMHNKPTTIRYITDRNGNEIYRYIPIQEQVISPEVAYAATSILRGVVQRGTAAGYAGISGRDIAGKTGTSEYWTDAWFCGYTPQLSCSVWVGYRDRPTYSNRMEGGRVASPIWREFMLRALEDKPAVEFQYRDAPRYLPNATFMTAEEREEHKLKTTDSDNDGFFDWDEMQAGTNPNDPNDYPGKPQDQGPPPSIAPPSIISPDIDPDGPGIGGDGDGGGGPPPIIGP